jgi:hypothetical protein
MALAQLWWDIARDETRRDSDRLRASECRPTAVGGSASTFAAIEEGDPLDLASLEQAAEEFRTSILRLARDSESDTEHRS